MGGTVSGVSTAAGTSICCIISTAVTIDFGPGVAVCSHGLAVDFGCYADISVAVKVGGAVSRGNTAAAADVCCIVPTAVTLNVGRGDAVNSLHIATLIGTSCVIPVTASISCTCTTNGALFQPSHPAITWRACGNLGAADGYRGGADCGEAHLASIGEAAGSWGAASVPGVGGAAAAMGDTALRSN